jgi:Fuc2NAc and GlcNAc transferase
MSFLWMILTVFSLSLVLTWALRRYALKAALMDIPNERSSHTVPTPRGGGVAIVVSFVVALPILAELDVLTWSDVTAVGGAGLLVAALGFADDHGHIAALYRLLGHFFAAAWLLFWLGGLAPVSFFGYGVDMGLIGFTLAVVYLVWLLNLYNFMDGIDGLASVEAISACLGMCVVYYVAGLSDLVWPPLILAVAVSGFLFWNFPPAKIFMGDAGSGFLGITLGGLSLVSAWHSPEMLWCWVIMLGVFVVDATFTLLKRVGRGEKVYQAHCSHAYQNASRFYSSHKRVTLMVAAINTFWLMPIALLVASGVVTGMAGVALAYSPVILVAWKFDAGSPYSKYGN